MPSIVLDKFKQNLGDLLRPNRFLISFDFDLESPLKSLFEDEDYYAIKGASIPGKTLGEIEVPWQGHKLKIITDPVFNDVIIHFYNNIPDANFGIRSKLEEWMTFISDENMNMKSNFDQYKGEIRIQQINGNGNPIKEYILVLAHPKEISDIELSMDNTDQIQEFSATFSYSFYRINNFTI